MSHEPDDTNEPERSDRRDLLRAAGGAAIGVAAAFAMNTAALGQTAASAASTASAVNRNTAALGARLQACSISV